MIPCLYAASETAFTTNGIGKLSDTVSCQVTEKRNSSYELKMTYPTDGIHADSIQKGCLILAKPSVAVSSQPFRIYKITTDQSGTMEIAARHVSYQLNDITASTVYGASCRSAILSLKTNATTPCDFTFSTDIDSDVPLSIDEPNSLRNCLGGIDGSILDTYGGEFEWDRFNVILHKERGADNGVRIVYGKNLVELTLKEDDGDVITGVHPFWKGSVSVEETDDSGDTTVDTQEVKVELPEKLVMVDGATEYRIRVLDCSTVFESQPTEEQLRAYAESFLASTSYTTPEIDVEINFAQLWQTPDYADIAAAEQVSLCDTVHVYLSKLGIEVSSKVTETVYDTLLERYESITLSNSTVVSSHSLVSTIDDLVSASVSALETKQAQEYSTLYASIQTLVAGSITAETVRAIIADFDYVAVDELDAAVADLGYVTAGEVSAKYAAIDLANVGVESAGTLFATVGLLTNMTVVDGNVTGTLNGVTINADVITAGTLSVDRLLLTGENGIIYAINATSSGLTESELSAEEYQKYINGTCIVANSITANQIAAGTITANEIDVSNLFAQNITATGTISGVTIKGATGDFSGTITSIDGKIGGFLIDSNSIYTDEAYENDGGFTVLTPMFLCNGAGIAPPYLEFAGGSDGVATFATSAVLTVGGGGTRSTGVSAFDYVELSMASSSGSTNIQLWDSKVSITGAVNLSSTLYAGSYLTVSGDVYSNSGDFKATNGHGFHSRNSDGTLVLIGQVNSSNQVLFGSTSYAAYLRGSAITLSGATTLSSTLSVSSTITAGNNIRIANGYGVYVADSGGTYRNLGGLNSSNNYNLCTGGVTSTIYLGTTSYTSNIYLRTAGSIYAGPKSIRVPEVQKGYISITPSAANTPTGSAVTFGSTFSGTPRVVVTPTTTVPGTTVTGVGTSGASTTGVTIYVTRTNTSSTGIHWIAVY